MSNEKKLTIVPMANFVAGQIFDKRAIQVPFERVVDAVNKIDPDFGALLQEGKGYTLVVNPITLSMAKEQQRQFQQPHAQPEYQRQSHMAFGGYGQPYLVNFAIIPNGHDRALMVNGTTDLVDLNNGLIQQPHQIVALQFAGAIDSILGDAPGVNRGFVEE